MALKILPLLFLLSFCVRHAFFMPSIIRIGAIFSNQEEEQETAFRFAIERINDDPNILAGTTLVAHVERVSSADSYNTERRREYLISVGILKINPSSIKVCSMLNTGVAGIIGPTSEITAMHTRSICDALEIPHIQVHWDVEPRKDALSLNLHPRPEVLADAYFDVVRGLGWDNFAIVYDNNEQVLLYRRFFMEARQRGWKLKTYQVKAGESFRDTFSRVKADEKKNIILDVRHYNLLTALKHAQQIGLVTAEQSYILTSLDTITENLEDYMYSGARIFTFRMVEDNNEEMKRLLTEWSLLAERTGIVNLPSPPEVLKTESALVYDAVKLLAMALGRLDKSQPVEVRPISCIDEVPWPHGTSLVNYMRPEVFRGLSGLMALDEFGMRSTFTLDILALNQSLEEGIENVGYWNSKSGLNITPTWMDSYSDFAITQRPWIITTAETEPFTMKKLTSLAPSGNAQFEGYAIDLIDELSLILGFKYEIRLCKDGKYGSEEPDGSWNGMIGELLREEADIAIVDLTITRKREKVVDFTLPFMTTGVSILYTKPAKAESSLFGFLSPFTPRVWISLVIATTFVSLIYFLSGRLTPYEWDNPYPCKEDQPILMNECSAKNSFWFTVGSLMQQGTDIAPKAMSTRIIGSVWYFFTLIMVSSYTANLAAFLTVEVVSYPFTNAEELGAQTKIGYGCGASGSTRVSFRDSSNPTLKRLSDFMEANPRMFVRNNKEGKQRVLKGNYAFFMEAATIEYAVERQCNFTQIGGLLDSKGYGIATRKDSPIRHALSRGILKLQEKGTLHILYERWWKQKRGGGACLASTSSGASAMTMANVGGVFVVLVAGLLTAGIIAIFEFVFRAKKMAPDWETAKEDMAADLSFLFRLGEYTKPNRRRKSIASSKGKKSTGPHPAFYKSVSSSNS